MVPFYFASVLIRLHPSRSLSKIIGLDLDLLLVIPHRFSDERLGGGGIFPALDLGHFLFEDFVALKEEGNFVADVFGNVVQVVNMLEARVVLSDGQDFFVFAFVIAHDEDADGADIHGDAREQRVRDHDQDVKRVAVTSEGLWEETVVAGVEHRGKEHAIEFDDTLFFVEFVLILAAFGNFDNGLANLGGFGSDR
jgi:hypothetical protein